MFHQRIRFSFLIVLLALIVGFAMDILFDACYTFLFFSFFHCQTIQFIRTLLQLLQCQCCELLVLNFFVCVFPQQNVCCVKRNENTNKVNYFTLPTSVHRPLASDIKYALTLTCVGIGVLDLLQKHFSFFVLLI